MITRPRLREAEREQETARRTYDDASTRTEGTVVNVDGPGTEIPPHEHVEPSAGLLAVRKVQQVVWYFFSLLETLLALRFTLLALGANPANPFFDALLTATSPLVQPFANLLQTQRVEGSTLEYSTIVAMVIYLLLAIAIARLLELLNPKTHAH
jgi:hypothetical protein